MASTYILKPSFAAGELTPSLYSRTDLAKYDVGAALLENMIVLRYGGVSRRPGLKHIARTATNGRTRLLPFRYNTSENYIIEMGAGITRFIYDGALVKTDAGEVYSIANTFKADELADIKYTQSADMMFLCHPNHAPMVLSRHAHNSWTLKTADIKGGPFEDVDTSSGVKVSASALTGSVTLTASKAYFTSDMVGRYIRLGHTVSGEYKKAAPGNGDATTLVVRCVPEATVYVESFGFWSGTFTLQRYDASSGSWVDVRSQNGNHSSNYNFTETNETGEITNYRIVSSDFNGSPWGSENENQPGLVTLQTFSHDYYGYAEITKVTSATTATANVTKELGAATATADFSISSWSDEKGYPVCCAFFEDRLVFAGSKGYPQTYWSSKTGDYFNFEQSLPSQDDDAITGTLSNGQMNAIRALIPFSELILLSAGSEYKLSGNNGTWTPSNQQVQVQEYRGINNLTPVVVGSRIIYVQHQGSIVRDFAYQYNTDKYTGDDVSLLANHLFDGHTITAITYQQTPNSLVWCVREDGVLLSMTYIKEQDVYAWHRHTTDGKFKDVCTIAGDNEDDLYCVVERDGDYYVEMMSDQIQKGDAANQFFVDAGTTIEGENMTTLSGLDWLAGKTVSILADGNVLPQAKVEDDGTLTLSERHGYSKVTVGLPYKSELQTLPIEINGQDGTWQSRKKRIARMMISFASSRGGTYGLVGGKLDEIKWRSTEPYGEAIRLVTEKKYVIVPTKGYGDTVAVDIRQDDPLPLTIISIVPEVVAGG